MKRMTLLMILAWGLLAACSNESSETLEDGEVSLSFTGTFGEEPLYMFDRSYTYREGMQVKFQLFNFYVSDLTLIREDDGDGEEIVISEVALANFADILDPDAAARGITLASAEVPPGVYRGIRFGLGLNPTQNASQPSEYPPGHPMTDNYWSWAMGYVFFKVEGNADLNGDGAFTGNDEKLTFHIGGDDYYHTVELPVIFEVGSGASYELDLQVDLEKVLDNGHEYIDFHEVTQDHTNDPELASFMAENMASAISMKD